MTSWLAVLSGLGHALLAAAGLLVYVLATRIGHQRRHPSAALGWVGGIVVFPYVAVPLFLMFGMRKFARPLRVPRQTLSAYPTHSQQPTHSADAAAVAGPAWALQLLACMDLAAPVHNRAIVFHRQGTEALSSLMGAIERSSRTLDVGTFVFGHDEVGQRVTAALLRAVQRGVAVRLLVDAVGSLKMPRSLLRELRAGGVDVQRFMPLWTSPIQGRTNLRNHRKLLVADGDYLWSGGRNLATEYFLDRPGTPAWVDLSYEVHGSVATQAAAQFDADWRMASGRLGALPSAPVRGALPLPDEHVPQGAQPPGPLAAGPWAQWVPSGPDHADDTVHTLLLAGAFQAQRRIVAVTPYFVPDDALLAAWCLACRRGVQVSLLLPRQSNHHLADWARERALRDLVAAGAQVWLADEMVHAKAVIMDDDIALCGSVNLDARSLFLNYEAMTAFYGTQEIRWLSDWCAQHIATAQPYDARRPSWTRDIAEGMVRSIAFQL